MQCILLDHHDCSYRIGGFNNDERTAKKRNGGLPLAAALSRGLSWGRARTGGFNNDERTATKTWWGISPGSRTVMWKGRANAEATVKSLV